MMGSLARKLLLLAVIAAAAGAYIAYTRDPGRQSTEVPAAAVADAADGDVDSDPVPGESETAANFQCDGRTHCSQMTSCDEAMYFLRNCPGVEMDGNSNGVPCERQWCGH